MKVLFITPYGFNDRLRYFTEFVIARNLAKLGWKVGACVLSEGEELSGRYIVDGVLVTRIRGRKDGIKHLFYLINQSQIIHIFHLRNVLGLIAFCYARLFRRPILFSEYGLLHDEFIVYDRDDPLSYPLKTHNLWSSPRSFFFHLPMNGADRIVFLSQHNLDVAQKLGMNMSKITWLPPVVDGCRFEQTESKPKHTLNLPREPFALFVGQMKLRKGWDVLLQAIPFVSSSILPKFVFVSPSSLNPPPPFKRLLEALDVCDRVIYIGKAPNRVLEALYRQCAAVIIPSRYEGFGLTMLEAFEAKKPIVASDVVALNEVLKHRVNGYLVPPKNPKALAGAIMEVMEDEDLRQQLVEGGRQTLNEFTVERWLPKWQEIYESLIK